MSTSRDRTVQDAVDAIHRNEGPRVLATLIRILGDFDAAEDAMQVAFAAAVEQWARDGVPANPRAWLISTARFKAIDAIRRETRLFASLQEVARSQEGNVEIFPEFDEHSIEDDRLRLIFTCCHPSLPADGQVALTLREVCGLTTEEIASAFLASTPTIAQRIVRAKARIRQDHIPYEVPPLPELAERTHNVLQVTYLVFNEGYYASSGENLTRQTLSGEAIRLGRLIVNLLPDPEVLGLLSLMLLQESRRAARASSDGELILFADQDLALWDDEMIREGLALVERAFDTPSPGTYALQAGIAAAHVRGALQGETDWDQIVGFYDQLLLRNPSPIVELNRAAAISMQDPESGLAAVNKLLAGSALEKYGLAHATQADIYRRLNRYQEAEQSYVRALGLATQSAERRFLERRIKEVSESTSK